MVNPDGLKRCPRCEQLKSAVDNFYKIKGSSDGYGSYCISCAKLKAIEHQKNNPELKKKYDRQTWLNSPERRAKAKQRAKEWIKKVPREILRAKARAYTAKYPEGTSASNANSRAKRLKLDGRYVTLTQWRRILIEWESKCAYCGEAAAEMDHIVTMAQRGLHDPANVVPACRACNAAKWSWDFIHFAAWKPLSPERVLRIWQHIEKHRGDAFPIDTAGYLGAICQVSATGVIETVGETPVPMLRGQQIIESKRGR